MKILVISDIHSNIYALRAVWERESDADLVVCAGDFVDYGTTPKEVIAWAREHDVRGVCGNHDRHLIDVYRSGNYRALPPEEFKWVHDNCRKLAEEDVAWLESLPEVLELEVDGILYTVRHMYRGYDVIEHMGAWREYLRGFSQADSEEKRPHRLVFGHRHRRCVHCLADDALWLNPGSVSYRRPDDPDKTAHYIVIEDGDIRLCSVEYDRTPLLAEAEKYIRDRAMMQSELQDARFFFGDAPTSREPIW